MSNVAPFHGLVTGSLEHLQSRPLENPSLASRSRAGADENAANPIGGKWDGARRLRQRTAKPSQPQGIRNGCFDLQISHSSVATNPAGRHSHARLWPMGPVYVVWLNATAALEWADHDEVTIGSL